MVPEKPAYYTVYTLRCPLDNMTRYVGITSQSLNERLRQHLTRNDNPYKWNWIKKLERAGLKPKIVGVYYYLGKDEACFLEKQLIEHYRFINGKKLTNILDGGNATPDWTGRKHKVSSIKKISKQVLKVQSGTGMVLDVYNSIREAARFNQCNEKTIRRASSNRQNALGFKWVLLSDLKSGIDLK